MGKKNFNSKFKIDGSEKGKSRRTFQGILFDSEMELKFFRDYLLPLQEKGEITSIEIQPQFILLDKFTKYNRVILPIKYIGDFKVDYSDGREIIYDVKGLPTEGAKLKRKLFDQRYPDKTLIWIALSVKFGGWIEFDKLQKMRLQEKKNKKGEK
jgi:hypothetical protein